MAIYVLTAVAGLPLLGWWVVALGHLQRARFRLVLRVGITRPPRRPGGWRRRLAAAAGSASAWRRLAYHLLSLVIGPAGGILVVACWTAILAAASLPAPLAGHGMPARLPGAAACVALLLAAPWVARAVAGIDAIAARALPGPSRAERLTQR